MTPSGTDLHGKLKKLEAVINNFVDDGFADQALTRIYAIARKQANEARYYAVVRLANQIKDSGLRKGFQDFFNYAEKELFPTMTTLDKYTGNRSIAMEVFFLIRKAFDNDNRKSLSRWGHGVTDVDVYETKSVDAIRLSSLLREAAVVSGYIYATEKDVNRAENLAISGKTFSIRPDFLTKQAKLMAKKIKNRSKILGRFEAMQRRWGNEVAFPFAEQLVELFPNSEYEQAYGEAVRDSQDLNPSPGYKSSNVIANMIYGCVYARFRKGR